MKIVWIVPGFSSDERDWCIPALLDLARAVAQRCELHVVALQYPYRRDVYHIGDATVHSLDGANRRAWRTPLLWRDAIHVIDQLQFDVIHAFWAYEPGVIAAWLRNRAPIVISLAGGELIDRPQIGYGPIGRWHVRWLLHWALRRANVITAGSKYLIEIARAFYREGCFEFAPLGVDVKLFNCSGGGPNGSTQRILNVGSLEPVKDQAALLHAFRLAADQLPTARLKIAGKGRLERDLRDLTNVLGLSDRVEFCGEIAHHQLPEVYRSAALYVQSSLHEAQGMAVLEAAACGLPIVGTKVGAVADLAPHGAVAVPVGDAHALARAIIEVLESSERAAQLSRAAQQAIEHEYRLERSADRFIQLYQSIVNG